MTKEFRIVLSDIEGVEPAVLAENIRATYGDDFDAALGDFTVELGDGGVVVALVREVTGGDVDALAEDIGNDVSGDFSIRVSQRQGTGWFVRDPGDDDLED